MVLEIHLQKTFGKMTNEQLYSFCQENPDLRIERDEFGQVFVMSPVNSLSSAQNNRLNYFVSHWNFQHNNGIVFDSSGGFILPDTSMRAPDVAWIAHERWEALTPEEQQSFAPICPDFVIELASKSDEIADLQIKMLKWVRNGVRLGWLVYPKGQKTYIYRPNGDIDVVAFDQTLSGEGVLVGFQLMMKAIL